MEKKSPGKYVLVFEPKYAYHQFAVHFTSQDDVKVTKIKKFSDLSYEKDKPVEKNLLGDIDRVLTSCTDLSHFFERYVDPKIFNYCGYNLHNMFIGYKHNGFIRILNYSINNPELYDKVKLVRGSKINDSLSIEQLINFATDPNGNNKFLSFIEKEKNRRATGLSNDTYQLLIDLRGCKFAIENFSDTGVFGPSMQLNHKLKENLSSYKEFRELFLLRQAYIKHLENEKEQLNKVKKEIPKKEKKIYLFEEPEFTFEQYSLFDQSYQKSKKK